jgi:hypothetical protein
MKASREREESENIYEEEQNIDDLVDYNDFDSKDLDSKDDLDSFNNDILKFYEDHKKNMNGKTNEVNNAQRPISSYQRVLLTETKKDNSLVKERENEKDFNEKEFNDEEEDFDEKLYYDYVTVNRRNEIENKDVVDEEENNYNDFENINIDDESKNGEKRKNSIKRKNSENKQEILKENKKLTKNNIIQKEKEIKKDTITTGKANILLINENKNSLNENSSNKNLLLKNNSPNKKDTSILIKSSSYIIEYTLEDFEDIKNRLNKFLNLYSISKSQFCDNTNLFFNFEDFLDLFKKIRFDFNRKDIKILFNHLNPNKEEGYILIKHFYNNLNLEFKELTFENTTEGCDLDRLNQQFKNLHSEILDVIKKDLVDQNIKRLGLKTAKYRPTGKLQQLQSIEINKSSTKKQLHLKNNRNDLRSAGLKSAISRQSGDKNNINSTGIGNITKSTESEYNTTSLRSFNRPMSSKIILGSIKNSSYLEQTSRPKLDVKNLLKAKIKKEKEEDIQMRQTFEKRTKDFIRDCMKKMEEANKMCVEMNVPKSFNSVTDDVSIIFF